MEMARKLNIPCRILYFHAPLEILAERVRKRYEMGNDASDADASVLFRQLAKQEKLTQAEEAVSFNINTTDPVDLTAIIKLLQSSMV